MIIKRKGAKKRKEVRNPIVDWPIRVVSQEMGCDRGTPIDRFYIEKFLTESRKYIKGNIMEIGDNSYTLRFGKDITTSYILTADRGKADCAESKVIHGDLQTGEGCGKDFLDCFILTQTLPFIYDIKSAAENIVSMLKSGGVALLTVSGISMISKYDDTRWGHYWGLTETAIRKLFDDLADSSQIEVFSMGNPKTAAAFLYGLSVEDLKPEDFAYHDELVPVMIGAIIHKQGRCI